MSNRARWGRSRQKRRREVEARKRWSEPYVRPPPQESATRMRARVDAAIARAREADAQRLSMSAARAFRAWCEAKP